MLGRGREWLWRACFALRLRRLLDRLKTLSEEDQLKEQPKTSIRPYGVILQPKGKCLDGKKRWAAVERSTHRSSPRALGVQPSIYPLCPPSGCPGAWHPHPLTLPPSLALVPRCTALSVPGLTWRLSGIELCLSPLCVELGRCLHISIQVKPPPFRREG